MIPPLVAGCGQGHVKQMEEFYTQVKGVVNPDELQSWATNLIAETTVVNGSTIDGKEENVPKFVRGTCLDDIFSWYDAFNRVRNDFFHQHKISAATVPVSTGVSGLNIPGSSTFGPLTPVLTGTVAAEN